MPFVYPNGEEVVDIPLGESLAAGSYGAGVATIGLSSRPSNTAPMYQTIATFTNSQVLIGPYDTPKQVLIQAGVDRVEYEVDDSPTLTQGPLVDSVDYSGAGSFQPVAIDLNVGADVGSDIGTNPKIIGAMMGNIIGSDLENDSNYLAGVIGAYAVTGTQASDYPTAGVMGIAFQSAEVDAIVLADLDGDDGGGPTRAGAMFGVAVNNGNAQSGVDYGLDLFATPNANYSSPDGPQGLNVTNAQIRMSDETCMLTGAGVPVDYTDGDPPATGQGFAGIGSLYIDTTNAALYINTGTKAEPAWTAFTQA